jgi:Spy/CpxP family protein refolding chaperone
MEEKLACAYEKGDDRRSGSGEKKRKKGYHLSALILTREGRKGTNQKKGKRREKRKKEGKE